MKKLAVCIPNYNRARELKRLLDTLSTQIVFDSLCADVEICVSDDCSAEDVQSVVKSTEMQYPKVDIKLHINKKNMGMDYNFLNCVQMADAEFCWIIGNDDLPEEHGLRIVMGYLDSGQEAIDLLVSPFDIYDKSDKVLASIIPIRDAGEESFVVHTSDAKEYSKLIHRVNNGNALFCFLSNVVFRRSAWVRHGDMFADKMQSIFIQMYMNLQTLKEGAVYRYVPDKFIRNYTDDELNSTFKREYDVLIGLSGVIDYFFTGEEHRKLQRCIVDERINGRMWDLPDDSLQKRSVMRIDSPKNDLYRKYFIKSEQRKDFFHAKKVLLYGAGAWGHRVLEEFENYNVDSVMVFDADTNKWGKRLDGYVIRSPQELFQAYHSGEWVVVVANNKALLEIVEMMYLNRIQEIALIT